MVSRRAFLRLTGAAGAAGLAAAAGCGSELVEPARADRLPNPPTGVPTDTDPPLVEDELGSAREDAEPLIEGPDGIPQSALFPLGVSAGDLDGEHATLWTKYEGSAPLKLVVWRMEGARYAEEHASTDITLVDGFAHVEVSGFSPGKRYRYAFCEIDALNNNARVARSIIGNLRAPIAGAEPLVIGAISCTDEDRPATVCARAAERNLDAFLFLGDTAYCDPAETTDEYRERWATHIARADHVALRASCASYATWDDHEVKNDWNPETIDPDQLAAAFAAFFEHMPLRRLEADPNRIWRSRRWGTTAEIFVLDSRSERLPSTILSDQEQYISRAQMDWFKQALLDSPCTFKVVMNSVPITRFGTVWNAWQVDRWDAYDAQRTEILTHIDDNAIPGVLWVSGDFHIAKMGYVSPEGLPGDSQVEVLVGPGAQSGNALAATIIEPYFHWKSTENNYTELHLDPATGEARIVYINADGDVIAEQTYQLV